MTDSTPPSTPKPTSGIGSLTVREGELLAKAWNCLKSGPPEIDYPKLAAEMGMSNHRSAMNAWGAIKKKMQWATGETPAGASASKATGTTASSKRKKPVASKPTDNEDDDDAAGQEATPIKKVKATPRAKGTKTPKKQPAARKPKTPAMVVKEEKSDSEMNDTEHDTVGEANKDGSVGHGHVVEAEAGIKNESGDEGGEEPIKSIEVAEKADNEDNSMDDCV